MHSKHLAGHTEPGRGLRWLAAGAALVMGALLLPTTATVREAAAQAEAPAAEAEAPAAEEAPDPAEVDRGRRAYLRANCVYCHGWDGRGSLVEGEPPAPGFVETYLDHAGIVEVATCGRIGTTMRRHLRTAWTEEHPCYGLTAADIPEDEMPLPPYNWLNEQDIDAVATYIVTVFKGKEMTYENCIAWFSEGARQCDQFRD